MRLAGGPKSQISYSSLNDEEAADVLELMAQSVGWLSQHQLKEHDFIRQALLDGLGQFRFRLARQQWLGWGYALASLKEVIAAYMALEHALAGASKNPDAEAALRKVGAFVQKFYEKTRFAKDIVATGYFMLRVYGA